MEFNFEGGRKQLFTKGYSQKQVDSINAILNECSINNVTQKEQIAYILATAKHESRLEPIEEEGGDKYLSKYDTGKLARILGNTPQADKDGQFYKGRGFVMITGKSNYSKFAKLTGKDLLRHPELALDIDTSAYILVYGMKYGTFTGKGLSDYINNSKIDYLNARRIINGVDKSSLIEGYAKKFCELISL